MTLILIVFGLASSFFGSVSVHYIALKTSSGRKRARAKDPSLPGDEAPEPLRQAMAAEKAAAALKGEKHDALSVANGAVRVELDGLGAYVAPNAPRIDTWELAVVA